MKVHLKYNTMAQKPHKAAAAAHTQAVKAQNHLSQPNKSNNMEHKMEPSADSDSEIEYTGWTGGINHILLDSEDEDWTNSDFDLEKLEGEELIKSLQIKCQHKVDLEQLAMLPTPYKSLLLARTPKD